MFDANFGHKRLLQELSDRAESFKWFAFLSSKIVPGLEIVQFCLRPSSVRVSSLSRKRPKKARIFAFIPLSISLEVILGSSNCDRRFPSPSLPDSSEWFIGTLNREAKILLFTLISSLCFIQLVQVGTRIIAK